MNLLIIGDYPVATQARMRAAFPTEWQITIAAPDACAPYLADAEVVIPEHVLVDDAFLAQAPRLRFVQVGAGYDLSLIHISEPTRQAFASRMPSSA